LAPTIDHALHQFVHLQIQIINYVDAVREHELKLDFNKAHTTTGRKLALVDSIGINMNIDISESQTHKVGHRSK